MRELLKTDKTIDKILVENGQRDEQSRAVVNEAVKRGVKVQYVEKAVIDKESDTKRHQGFIAYTSDYEYADFDEMIDAVANKQEALLLVLDGIEDPHNLGSIIRVAECAGADGIIIGKRRSAQVTETVMRVSAGGANHVKIARVTNINAAIRRLSSSAAKIRA